jgi:phage-related protein
MTYSTFPAVPLKSELSKEVRSLATKQPLGDGYSYITQFGLHPLEETWRVRMLIKLSEADTVRSFLEARATDGTPFLWTPPDYSEGIAPMWRVEEWPIAREFQSRVEIDLLLRRRWGELGPSGIGIIEIGDVPHYGLMKPSLEAGDWVRWVGVQWFERAYGGTGGGSGPWDPVTINVNTGWEPLRTASGELITYGIGGMQQDKTGPYGITISASRYLGPWYSNIDIYFESWGDVVVSSGSADAFFLWSEHPTEGLQSAFTNYGFSYGRSLPDTTNFATSRGRWEFANAAYEVIYTWDGYSKLRPDAVI